MQTSTAQSQGFTVRQVEGLKDIKAEDWNQLVPDNNPFLLYDFLHGLEKHRCLDGHGWLPCHLLLNDNDKLIAAIPLYLKSNSYGEFVFDWAWADAYERAGGSYYPKLVSAIPFSPVSGPRLLIHPQHAQQETIKKHLIEACLHFVKTNKLSSFHCLFPDKEEVAAFSNHAFLLRKTCQFHWHNQAYRDFDDFLDKLSSKKRKQIKRERRQVKEQGLEIEALMGKDISEQQWRVFYNFYCSTFHRRWGEPRLTLDFFLSLSETLPEQTLLFLAKHQAKYVAGAFAMRGQDALYGRHWGCSEQFSQLHFELCYYQTIEFSIKHGIQRVDAGVQGEHKINRGFQALALPSCHWIAHDGFRQAIDDYLRRERVEIDRYVAMLKEHSPFKRNT